jgi:hypothetical protein
MFVAGEFCNSSSDCCPTSAATRTKADPAEDFHCQV